MRIDFAHFWPRYGVAVAIYRSNSSVMAAEQLSDRELALMLARALEHELSHVMLYTRNNPAYDEELVFESVSHDRLNPGQEVDGKKQSADNGYYLSPHVATSNNAADVVSNARKIIEGLRSETPDLSASFELLRSFAPLVSMINNGNKSMGNPKVDLFEAACTALATLTQAKPASFAEVNNHVLIPDLPLYEGEGEPLVDFIRLFDDICAKNQEAGRYTTRRKEQKKRLKSGKGKVTYEFKRPPVFQGNYPAAPWDATLGPLGVLAAIGIWVGEAEVFCGHPRGVFAERILKHLTCNPLYVVSYGGRRQQEHLGHHLVRIALEARFQFPHLVRAIGRTKLYNGGHQGERLFRRMAARFIQSYEPAAFRDFLAFRAEYDASFTLLLEDYFMENTMAELSQDRRKQIVNSARAFGAALNYAAWQAARDEVEDDRKRGRQVRSETEYKARKLVVLESTAFSAKTHTALLSQLATMAGRETGGRDLGAEAGLFMEAVAAQEISLEEARQLAIAFMRLRKAGSKDVDAVPATDEDDAEDDLTQDPMPED